MKHRRHLIRGYSSFDLMTLGAARALRRHLLCEGKRVAVIDGKYIGGSSPNVACLPSKKSSTARKSHTVAEARMRHRKRKMVVGLNQM